MSSPNTPSFVFQVEKRMRSIQENEYARALLAENNWWTKVARTMPTDGASERLTWFLSTAQIRPVGKGGSVPFEPLVTQSTEIVPQRYAAATRINKDEYLDLRGGGLDALTEWSAQIGVETAYSPQRFLAELFMNGAATDGSAASYDSVPFFADNNTSTTFGGTAVTGHPYNPYRPLLGGYTNWLHGASATVTQPNGSTYTYPGALPIDDSVSITTAFTNLGKAIAYVGGWKMPNGITPRFLRPRMLLVPPRMVPQVAQLTDTRFIAQVAGSGAGSGDVQATIKRWGLETPVEVQEFAATTNYTTQLMLANQTATGQASGVQTLYNKTITGNDTTWYLVMEELRTTTLGSFIHLLREPYKVNYFFGEGASGASGIDAILNRMLEIEYICQGRMSLQYGHPYGVVRVDGV
jgi:hypothetical protein